MVDILQEKAPYIIHFTEPEIGIYHIVSACRLIRYGTHKSQRRKNAILCITSVRHMRSSCFTREIWPLVKITVKNNLHKALVLTVGLFLFSIGCGTLYVTDGLWRIRHSHCVWPMKVMTNVISFFTLLERCFSLMAMHGEGGGSNRPAAFIFETAYWHV